MKTAFSIIFIMTFFVGISCQSNTSQGNGKIIIKDPWIKEASTSQKMSGGYMTLENTNSQSDKLLSIQSDVCEVIELHKMTYENDIMKMRRVSDIEVPANGSVQLKQGGFHLMLISLKKDLKAGDKITLTLNFKNAGKQSITVPVKKLESMMHH
ncbi:MAG: hypothetical protein IEMM0008_1365 [bacterium]|nr:MAG: hypothetical protein IEMM0008_1365 [bacterium]